MKELFPFRDEANTLEYILIETIKANGPDVYYYLTYFKKFQMLKY